MSDPERLLESGSELERELLRSARDDAPSPRALRRAMVASVGAVATTAAAGGASAGAIGAAALLKWAALGAAGGLVLLGVSEMPLGKTAAPSDAPPIAAPAPARSAAAPVEARAPASEALTSAPAAPAADTLSSAPAPVPAPDRPAAEAARNVAPPPEGSETAAAPTPSSLAEELSELDRAREALASGDAARALETLDRHDESFPSAQLRLEAEVLRIQALAARGERAAARARAESFLAAHPTGPLSARVSSILASTNP